MSDNKIQLSGIFSEGYGVIPKKFMRMQININIKAIIAYMLSYTGRGNTCFPGIKTISKDLGISHTTVIKYINQAVSFGLIIKSKLNKDPLNHANKYTLLFLESDVPPGGISDVPPGGTTNVHEVEKNNNNINNNNINNKDIHPPQKTIKKPDKNKYLDFVLLTTAEHDSLIQKYGKDVTDEYIERVNNYVGSNGRRYKSHYFTILQWIKKDNVKKMPPKKYCPDCKTEINAGGLCKKCGVYVVGIKNI